ncbi:hypothetical protein Tco_1110023 [Tanacetum coccineum]|uniref:Xylulose kinase-1 n=1 Tax=Tanacetum coccineum TaxID=301880 RepID=A0ABQ5IHM9_9ASTR
MVAYLEKSEGSEGFHEIIDFFSASHIHYALTPSPTIYTSLIEQFWQTAALCTINDGVLGITATIDRKVKITVSEGSIRRHLKLKDSEGIPSLPTIEIFKQLALMGAPSTSQPPITPTEEAAPMPHESPLHSVHSLGRDEGSKARRRVRIVILEDEDAAEDSSKQGRKISHIDIDPTISLDDTDTLWKLQRYMHDHLKWWLYDTCGVHHVSIERGHAIFMLVEKNYPLTTALLTLMLCNKLRVDQYSEMADELL